METQRLRPLSGIAFVALVAIAIVGVAGETPGTDASGSELVSFYGDSWRQFIAAFVLAASTPFLVVFGASIASTETGERSVWRLVLIAGTAVTAVVVLVQALLHLALTDGADQGVPESALQAVNTLAGSTWVAFFAAFGLMMLGAGGCLVPRPGAYRWLGWTALVLGIALFFPAADFFAALLSAIWIIVASLMIARGAGQAAPKSQLERAVSSSVHP
jgi:MFS family permease